MIVIGAGGFSKEILEVLLSEKYKYNENNLFFFDNVSKDLPHKLFKRFIIIRSFEEAKKIIANNSPDFVLGLGGTQIRYNLSKKFEEMGGRMKTIISKHTQIGVYGNISIGEGNTIMNGVFVSSGTSTGKGTLLNVNSMIGHDVTIGNFVEIMPGVNITSHCCISDYTTIGTGCILTPGVKIGNNCSIAAGSVVTKDIPDNSLVVGIMPSRVVERLPEFEL